MVVIFPLIFSAIFYWFVAFIIGDYQWVEHASSWAGGWGLFSRIVYAVAYLFGLLCAFCAGVSVDDSL